MHPNVLSVALRADQAFDEKDIHSLETIVGECLEFIDSSDYNDLERAIFAYHGATSQGNRNGLLYSGQLEHSDENNNEENFELSLYLYRKSLEYFSKYKSEPVQRASATREDEAYYTGYLLRSTTNYANELQSIGRLTRSINQLKHGVNEEFPMALGSMGLKLIDYARIDYDEGHSQVLLNEGSRLLKQALTSPDVDEYARIVFNAEVERVKDYVNENIFDEFSLGSSEKKKTIDLGVCTTAYS